jgi:type II secretory pathway pseudopilin PulG
VEVLVATAVLAIGIAAGVQAMGAMARASAAAADRATAVRLAAGRLALLEAAEDAQQGALQADSSGAVALTDAEGQDAVDPRFHWQQSVAASASEPGLLEVTVTVSWPAGRTQQRYAVTTYLPDPNAQTGNGTTTGTTGTSG